MGLIPIRPNDCKIKPVNVSSMFQLACAGICEGIPTTPPAVLVACTHWSSAGHLRPWHLCPGCMAPIGFLLPPAAAPTAGLGVCGPGCGTHLSSYRATQAPPAGLGICGPVAWPPLVFLPCHLLQLQLLVLVEVDNPGLTERRWSWWR